MNHHQLEKDIEHLEQVIARLSGNDRIPLSYWRNRIESVSNANLVPSQIQRVKRLAQALGELEMRVKEGSSHETVR
ncbi:hypothetical protein LMG28688_04280 [Paraburkholderia caffeinitolerans]|uniref:Uncharacterized protein n=1 Tax=Paraburkholderia caffeinitolerans TaxID=1723730 RepID=A0A6J5GCZ2_9BURK|nr:hypothetical protein [Paraburkholderia caffeinitolerans]CAB3796399.1 hypothetical protein LMG28688_04280 [Paraburkholderia caffeinitolerans]